MIPWMNALIAVIEGSSKTKFGGRALMTATGTTLDLRSARRTKFRIDSAVRLKDAISQDVNIEPKQTISIPIASSNKDIICVV